MKQRLHSNPWQLRPGERIEDLDVRISLTEWQRAIVTVACPDGNGWGEIIDAEGVEL